LIDAGRRAVFCPPTKGILPYAPATCSKGSGFKLRSACLVTKVH
jgi:hypothetical protein